ncbi:MAG: GTPase HflX [Endomicrobiia bacterium]
MEKVVVVGTILKSYNKEEIKSEYKSLDELSSLVSTARGIVLKTFLVKRDKIDPAYYIGKGKAEEIGRYVNENKIRTVIFDNELSVAQIRNLEKKIDAKIIDRTRLILDIFAQRAHTKEAKLQVELAQMQYILPRLTQKGIYMDNQVGGIGTRGPGETKLEYDRRKIMLRIEKIKDELKKVVISRQEQRKLRLESKIPLVALVGYTNTGKSTLFNMLLNSLEAYADDKLFATLDPLVRKLKLPNNDEILIVDTVGFINKLPHNLIESFKSTLEIVKDASLLLEVIDITSEDNLQREKLVRQILEDIGVKNIPVLKVYNKVDLLDKEIKESYIKKLKNKKDSVIISAKTGFGIEKLLKKIQECLNFNTIVKTIKIFQNQYEILNFVYKYCKVMNNNVDNNCIILKIQTTKKIFEKIKELIRSNLKQ